MSANPKDQFCILRESSDFLTALVQHTAKPDARESAEDTKD
jgi:hypothetical protein